MKQHDDVLEYFRRELAYLRAQGHDFSQRHPKVAQRLALSGTESPDPHTERLIEAVAFLNARVHRDLDREFPKVAEALLDNLCPNLTQPIPSITIVHMGLDPAQGKVTSGLKVGRSEMLQARTSQGQVCHFQTAWDTTLWPLDIVGTLLPDPRTLSLEFQGHPGTDLGELEIDSLRLHLGGELMTCMMLHELLLTGLEDMELVTSAGRCKLAPAAMAECGFSEDHDVIPRPGNAHPAYGLLQEYFAFPRKYQFFELQGLRGKLGTGSRFELRLVFSHANRALSSVDASTFRLGCVPVINLFPQTSEPIQITHRQHEYLLVADRTREAETEVHSIRAVVASDPAAERPQYIPSIYTSPETTGGTYWSSRRDLCLRKGMTGTDVYLSFVDQTNLRDEPAVPVVFAELLCTNRRLAQQMPAGVRLVGNGVASSVQIRTLYEPSDQRDPVMASSALWALVRLQRLNHGSLFDGTSGVDSLREVLMLFAGERASDQIQIRGLRSVKARSTTARVGDQTWRGHCRGTEVTLEFDDDAFAGNSPLVLAGVLARFFALYTTANSFVRLRVERRGEVWKQWPAMGGRQCVA